MLITGSVRVVTGHRWRAPCGSFEGYLVKGLFIKRWVGVGTPQGIMRPPGGSNRELGPRRTLEPGAVAPPWRWQGLPGMSWEI